MRKPFFYDDEFMWETLGIHKMPKNLFQYTSIDSLEKILQNQTIRFSRLDTVNDPEEAKAEDIADVATSVFVSCWSDSEIESIPMWSMYGDQFQGVRLCLPANMFLGRDEPRVFDKGGAKLVVGREEDTVRQWEIAREPPAMSTVGRFLIGPNKIHYSNDPVFRQPRIIHPDVGGVRCYTYDVGMVKSEHWSYEREWRFKLSWFPEEVLWPDDEFFRTVSADLKSHRVLTDQVFVRLDPTAVDEIAITIGPLMPVEERKRVSEIQAKYAPSAIVKDSEIPLRARPGKHVE